MRQQQGEAGLAGTVVTCDAPSALPGFLVKARRDAIQALLNLTRDHIALERRWIAEVALEMRGAQEPALDVDVIRYSYGGHRMRVPRCFLSLLMLRKQILMSIALAFGAGRSVY